MFETSSTRRSYTDIAQFGYSMHHLFDHFLHSLNEGESITAVGRKYYLHPSKREMRNLRGGTDRIITERDIRIAEFAITVAQSIMATTYSRHAMGVLDEDEVYRVPLR
jgi:hypothetical protein